jgi:hypothetical protein
MSAPGSIALSESTARLMFSTGRRFPVTGSRLSKVCCEARSRTSSRIAVPFSSQTNEGTSSTSLPRPATHSVVRAGVWACSPEHAKRRGRCRRPRKAQFFRADMSFILFVCCGNCARGGEIARSVTRLLWIRLICDLELNFRVPGDDLIAPCAFCAIQRGVCDRNCIFLCIQPGGQDGRTRAYGDSNC